MFCFVSSSVCLFFEYLSYPIIVCIQNGYLFIFLMRWVKKIIFIALLCEDFVHLLKTSMPHPAASRSVNTVM